MSAPLRTRMAAALALVATAGAGARELEELRVYPPAVNLTSAGDRQSVVVQAVFDDTTTQDVTAEADIAFPATGIVRRVDATLHPVAGGTTEVRVAYGGRTSSVPVRVAGTGADRPVSFALDVMPAIMKGGCNTGPCHGSARGQDGFLLSLFGFDPNGDYFRITRERSGRRINLADPAGSLLIRKALGKVPHTGGQLFEEDGEHAAVLMSWLRAGAPKDPPTVPRPVALELMPDRIVLAGAGARQQLTARVRYSDGTDRDVTSSTVFLSNNESSAKVSKQGLIGAGQRGEAFVQARYDIFNVGAQVIVIPADASAEWPDVPEYNELDRLVHAKLRRLRIVPSPVCSDGEFLRRVHIDLVGRLPERPVHDAFLADTNADKRARMVDGLIARKEFVELWVMKWAELLQIRSNNEFSYKSAVLYFNWLQDRIGKGTPLDRIVRELVGASGGTFKNPATNYYQIERDTLKVAENAAQVFLGTRLQCTQCHNHPFDRWTMDDYYGFAAFFAQIGRKPGEDPRETIVFNSGGGEMQHPVDKRAMPPRFLGGEAPDLQGRDRRVVLAEWLTSTNNAWFARNLGNLVWAHFLGRGVVEPVDDVRVSNPPSNPELLEELGRRMIAHGFDFRRLVRDICTSRTYQLSTRTNESNAFDVRNFSHASPRRVRAEVLLDCISQVTETRNKFQGLPLGARAVQIADGNVSTYFLKTFGRATRDTVCSCEVVMEPSLSQALHLLNGETTQKKIREGGVVKRALEGGAAPGAVVEDLYLRCLARRPTAAEADKLLAAIAAEPDRIQAVEDVFWALLNSKEFIFNH